MKLETLIEKITPLPYSHHEKLDAHNQSLGHAVEARATTVAELDVTEPPELGGYDAAYLVHCANSFPKLLEALTRISNGNDVGRMTEWANDALTQAREVKG